MTGVELCIIIKASLAWLSPYQEKIACNNAEYIIQQSEKRAIDPLIVAAIIYRESAFSPGVVSKAGACGLTQVLPKYSKYTCKQLKQPRVAIREGVRALNLWLTWAEGSMGKKGENRSKLDIALCGYNAGFRCIRYPKSKVTRRVMRVYVGRVKRTYLKLKREFDDRFNRSSSEEAEKHN
tara:strand:+ start:156 stop:695 length:540 start_codon:yes stop_codon:yes gene_type:complete